MTDTREPAPLPTAPVRRRRRIPLVWIVPLLTGLIGVWLAWDTYSKRGPTITISFETAAGLTAGQSQLKYKNVVMGTVKTIAVASDLSHVEVTVETTREAESLLLDTTIFWVVKPQLFAGNITGLDTLLSGSYIGMRPNPTATGNPKRDFVGEEDPPILQAWAKGTVFKLQTHRLGSISLGSPVFFRDLEVGTVLGWDQITLAENVTIHAFVRAPFDQYVRLDTSFWNASGMNIKFSGEGISIQVESLRAVLLGGIAFDTPSESKQAAAKPYQTFHMYSSREAARTAGFGHQLQLLSYFPGSVAGLSVGAEVTLYGLKVGEVTGVGLVYDPVKDRIVAPVHYRVEADRVTGIATVKGLEPGKLAEEMIRRGLRATLEAPSLISGSKIVALQVMSDAPAAELKRDGDIFIIPAVEAGGFDSITRSAAELLSKINRIDFDGIGKSISGAATGLDNTINGPQIKATLAALEKAMIDVQDIAKKLDQGATPAMKRLPEIAAALQESLTRATRLFASLNAGYGDDSRFRRDLDRLLPQLTDTARSFRALADLLSRHPEALIKGRTNTGKE